MNRIKEYFANLIGYFRPSLKTRKKQLAKLRDSWGKESSRGRKYDLVSILHDLNAEAAGKEMVDDRTWKDLDMDEVFAKIDRCVGAVGSQYLYRLLRIYETNKEILKERSRQYDLFRKDNNLRESLQLPLLHLEHENASFIAHLIYGVLPSKSRLDYLIYLSSFGSIASLAGLFFFNQMLISVILFALLNIVIHDLYSRKIYKYFAGLSFLNTMLGLAVKLSSVKTDHDLQQICYLKKNKTVALDLKKKIGWLVMDKSRLSELMDMLVEYLNLICLFDIIAFIRSMEHLKRHRSELAGIFEAIGSLDASLAVASYLEGLNYFTAPHINPDRRIDVAGIYHPLLDYPVANSFRLEDKSALVTGSNMAGKTTFIKTVGVNLILARTLHICLAERADLPESIVRSSIERSDELAGGKSSFFVEVETLSGFIRLADNGKKYLFLIDEIYRGTNTVERIASSAAVLNYLGHKHQILVTTHDVELQELLKGIYNMYHFSEKVDGSNYYFDYKLSPGPCRSRNAIKLLKLRGYPESVTTAADLLAKELSIKFDNAG